ncbi:MAG: hypothetical protein BZY75_03450 [SAR202 cluster bacterium Io17-Chloro-G7]|nr:MAG: hypothetical protein BZY75_03450 [SAR202 cluster bacterium Io17-Chloro-G7]
MLYEQCHAHLLAIYDHIGHNSELYAIQVADRLTRRSEQIGAFPLSGRTVPEYQNPDIRERIEGPYRIIYLIKPGHVDVVALIHGHQALPPFV